MTRPEVLVILEKAARLKSRGIAADQVPVHFIGQRIAVILPHDAFTADDQIRVEGKFQCLMTGARAHGFLDFVPDWQGLATPLRRGFN